VEERHRLARSSWVVQSTWTTQIVGKLVRTIWVFDQVADSGIAEGNQGRGKGGLFCCGSCDDVAASAGLVWGGSKRQGVCAPSGRHVCSRGERGRSREIDFGPRVASTCRQTSREWAI
jgi:hypothetical protein